MQAGLQVGLQAGLQRGLQRGAPRRRMLPLRAAARTSGAAVPTDAHTYMHVYVSSCGRAHLCTCLGRAWDVLGTCLGRARALPDTSLWAPSRAPICSEEAEAAPCTWCMYWWRTAAIELAAASQL